MDYLIGFVLLLGVLIAIHEFGHFIVAKAFGIRVEIFSLGMGKKILTVKKGETEYALSLIPLGGYVKLLGQDPREEVPPELTHRAFRSKPLWQRACVVLAGPAFNAILAVLLMTVIFQIGAPSPAAQIERIDPGSPAEQAGFRAEDRVLSVKSADKSWRIRELSDLENALAKSVDKNLAFEIERLDESRIPQKAQIAYTPSWGRTRDPNTGVMKRQGVINGADYGALRSIVYVPVAKSWAGERRLPTSFWIEEVQYSVENVKQDLKVENFRELDAAWKSAVLSQRQQPRGQIVLKGYKIDLAADEKAQETPELLSFTLAWTTAKDAPSEQLDRAGLLSHEFVILDVNKDSPAAKLGLKAGDLITALNGVAVTNFRSFKERIQHLAAQGQNIEIAWSREGAPMKASVLPEKVTYTDPLTQTEGKEFQIGARFLPTQADPKLVNVKADNIFDATSLGFHKTVQLTSSMLKSFYHLATGDIALKTLGGPILIGKIAGESYRRGWVPFFKTMVFISLNLFVLNLLPVPVLDGGHLVLYIVEAIRRKPLSVRVVEIWSTTGFFLLMGLVAMVFFNDLSRVGFFKIFSS